MSVENIFDYSSIIAIRDLIEECNIREEAVLENESLNAKIKLGYVMAIRDIVGYAYFLDRVSEKELADFEQGAEKEDEAPIPSDKVDHILKILRNSKRVS